MYNVGPDVYYVGSRIRCPHCEIVIYPEWNGHDGIWECLECDGDVTDALEEVC